MNIPAWKWEGLKSLTPSRELLAADGCWGKKSPFSLRVQHLIGHSIDGPALVDSTNWFQWGEGLGEDGRILEELEGEERGRT